MAHGAAAAQDLQSGFKRPWTLVAVLTVLSTYSFLDRVLMVLLVDPIKAELHLSDSQMGMLLGFAFAGLYALATLPSGFLVDRMDRRLLIGITSAAWSAMTLVSAYAGNFGQMFLGRAGVGLAEALVVPASFSLIRDALPERSHGAAFSIFAMSPIIGASAALIGGGALLHALNAGAAFGLGELAALAPWRVVMGLAGLLGLPLSLLLLAVREPARGSSNAGVAAASATAQALEHVRRNCLGYMALTAYAAFGAMLAFGQGAWLPTTLGRKFGLAPERIGPMIGGLNLASGLLGLIVTGFLLRRMASAGRDISGLGALAALCAAAGLAGAALAPTLTIALICTGLGNFLIGTSFPVGATILSQFTPGPLMGRISAVYLLCQTLIGQSLGPLLIATSAARMFGGVQPLASAFATMVVLYGVLAAASALAMRRPVAAAGEPALRPRPTIRTSP